MSSHLSCVFLIYPMEEADFLTFEPLNGVKDSDLGMKGNLHSCLNVALNDVYITWICVCVHVCKCIYR